MHGQRDTFHGACDGHDLKVGTPTRATLLGRQRVAVKLAAVAIAPTHIAKQGSIWPTAPSEPLKVAAPFGVQQRSARYAFCRDRSEASFFVACWTSRNF